MIKISLTWITRLYNYIIYVLAIVAESHSTGRSIPIVAIGGITAENGALFPSMGRDGLAAISAILSQPDIRLAAAELKNLYVQNKV